MKKSEGWRIEVSPDESRKRKVLEIIIDLPFDLFPIKNITLKRHEH